MKLTAGNDQFVYVRDELAGPFLANGWTEVKDRPVKAAPSRKSRRKVDDGVDATE